MQVPIPHLPLPSPLALPGETDTLCKDEQSKSQRVDILRRQKWNALFYGVQQTFMFVSGPLIGAGLAMAMPFISGSATTRLAEATAQQAAGVEGASALVQSAQLGLEAATTNLYLGLGVLAVAATAATIAITANQVGSRIFHAASFDQSEINAQHTAKYMALELKKQFGDTAPPLAPKTVKTPETPETPEVVIFNQADSGRADGKSWASHVTQSRNAAAQQLG